MIFNVIKVRDIRITLIIITYLNTFRYYYDNRYIALIIFSENIKKSVFVTRINFLVIFLRVEIY